MLNARQEKFIQNIVKGMSQREAYKTAYKAKYKDEAIDIKACQLFNSDKVQIRYKELIDQLEDKAIMSAKERMQFLTKIINGEEQEAFFIGEVQGKKEADLNTKIKALDTLNKMSGEYVTNIKGSLNLSYEEALKKVSEEDEY